MSSQPQTKATPTFHPFPSLPPELRLQIWSLCLSQPRTIAITCKRATDPTRHMPKFYAESFSTDSPPPALLHVNCEARWLALGVYTAYFRTESHNQKQNETETETQTDEKEKTNAGVYIDFAKDVLRLREDVLGYIPSRELHCIASMVVEIGDIEYFGHFCMDTLLQMPKLTSLDLEVQLGETGRGYVSWGERVDTGVGIAAEGAFDRGVRRERVIRVLETEFLDARRRESGWDCPFVRIFGMGEGGGVLGVIQGGRLDEIEE
ncbi:hypothetical protein BJX99DRAFT_263481 [Aspergillus californicus]